MPRFDQMVKGGSKPEAEEAEGSADDWCVPEIRWHQVYNEAAAGPQKLECLILATRISLLGLRCLPETADYWQFLYASK